MKLNTNQKRRRDLKIERRARLKKSNVPGAGICGCGHTEGLHLPAAADAHPRICEEPNCGCGAYTEIGKMEAPEPTVSEQRGPEIQSVDDPEDPRGPEVTEEMLRKLEGYDADMTKDAWTQGWSTHHVATIHGRRIGDFQHGTDGQGAAYMRNCVPHLIAEIRRLRAQERPIICGPVLLQPIDEKPLDAAEIAAEVEKFKQKNPNFRARTLSPFVRTTKEQTRDFPEDAAHENGNYYNTCVTCDESFIGHKRRYTCRVCMLKIQPPKAERTT